MDIGAIYHLLQEYNPQTGTLTIPKSGLYHLIDDSVPQILFHLLINNQAYLNGFLMDDYGYLVSDDDNYLLPYNYRPNVTTGGTKVLSGYESPNYYFYQIKFTVSPRSQWEGYTNKVTITTDADNIYLETNTDDPVAILLQLINTAQANYAFTVSTDYTTLNSVGFLISARLNNQYIDVNPNLIAGYE